MAAGDTANGINWVGVCRLDELDNNRTIGTPTTAYTPWGACFADEVLYIQE
jgi:hypothetical protein